MGDGEASELSRESQPRGGGRQKGEAQHQRLARRRGKEEEDCRDSDGLDELEIRELARRHP